MKAQFTVGVFGIVFDDQQRVLLCHRRDYDFWNLPGGGLEYGESPWDGVVREIKEETGLETEVIKLAGLYNKPDKKELVLSFLCKMISGTTTLNDEADKIEYFEINKLPTNISQKHVERIKDAIENKGLTMKNQIGKSAIDLIREGKL